MNGKTSQPEAISTFVRWWKFNLVGAVGIGVQFAALFLLKSVLKFDYLLSTAIAVEAAVVHNFVWHEQFTWRDRVQPSWRGSLPRFLRFNLTVGAVSLLGNLGLMRVMVGAGRMNYLLASAIAVALCALANFLVSDQWVFGESGKYPAGPVAIARHTAAGRGHSRTRSERPDDAELRKAYLHRVGAYLVLGSKERNRVPVDRFQSV